MHCRIERICHTSAQRLNVTPSDPIPPHDDTVDLITEEGQGNTRNCIVMEITLCHSMQSTNHWMLRLKRDIPSLPPLRTAKPLATNIVSSKPRVFARQMEKLEQ